MLNARRKGNVIKSVQRSEKPNTNMIGASCARVQSTRKQNKLNLYKEGLHMTHPCFEHRLQSPLSECAEKLRSLAAVSKNQQ